MNEFQTQLLIARVQFGEGEIPAVPKHASVRQRGAHPRAWARVAAVGVLALAIFLGLLQWVGS
ncbi:MAG: hypothetical protein KAY37_13390 [Phycisphaerae bacterium]|nr:hypothetical protein [Phycisphaerae bacterium]